MGAMGIMIGLLVLLLTSGLLFVQGTESQSFFLNIELDEEFQQEATADGFLTGFKQTSFVKNDISLSREHLTLLSAHQNHSTITSSKSRAVANAKPKSFSQNGSHAPTTSTTVEDPEGSGDLSKTYTSLTTNSDVRMLLKSPNEVQNQNLVLSMTARNPQVDIHSSTDVIDGSGFNPNDTMVNSFTAKPTMIVEEIFQSVELSVQKSGRKKQAASSDLETTKAVPNIVANDVDSKPTISAQAQKGTPDWLIIFAFCLTVGAILCILAGIAMKDKWYGPSRRTLNVEPVCLSTEEYVKIATLPLSEKELQLMTLLSDEKQTAKDFSVISLEEKEKEYLMYPC